MKFLLLWSVESNLIKIFNHPSNAFFATPPNPLSKAIITRPSLLDGQLEGGIRVGFGLSDGDKAMREVEVSRGGNGDGGRGGNGGGARERREGQDDDLTSTWWA
eukprot:TRINITY_DN16698_c0_g1_i1.p1 TRINITY_DN16698_c0_g1~~TRINITY_DN16698_c0_g1_i1.p1  ORF type:complete len:104 (+),score=26.92 TRINITY_DN16698_c0_g1_i1:382-693(+)